MCMTNFKSIYHEPPKSKISMLTVHVHVQTKQKKQKKQKKKHKKCLQYSSKWVSECSQAIFQLYPGQTSYSRCDDDVHFVLLSNTLIWNLIVLVHYKKKSADKHVAPIGHISEPTSLCSYTLKLCGGEASNT
jgi:hypothetical protein